MNKTKVTYESQETVTGRVRGTAEWIKYQAILRVDDVNDEWMRWHKREVARNWILSRLHSDVRIGELGRYIQDEIENRIPGLGWQNYELQIPKWLRSGYIRPIYSRLRLAVVSALGVFVGIGCLILVIWKNSTSFDLQEHWFWADVISLVVTTFLLLFSRRP